MVGINDLLLGALIVITGSTLIKKVSSIPSKEGLPISDQIYQTRQKVNFQALQDITTAQDKLQNIRSQTLQQEKFKTGFQIDALQTAKSQAGGLLSQLAKVIDQGASAARYSPRVRGIILGKYGYDPVDYEAIKQGQEASKQVPLINEFIKKIDQNIINLNKSYTTLEGI